MRLNAAESARWGSEMGIRERKYKFFMVSLEKRGDLIIEAESEEAVRKAIEGTSPSELEEMCGDPSWHHSISPTKCPKDKTDAAVMDGEFKNTEDFESEMSDLEAEEGSAPEPDKITLDLFKDESNKAHGIYVDPADPDSGDRFVFILRRKKEHGPDEFCGGGVAYTFDDAAGRMFEMAHAHLSAMKSFHCGSEFRGEVSISRHLRDEGPIKKVIAKFGDPDNLSETQIDGSVKRSAYWIDRWRLFYGEQNLGG